MAWVTTLEKKKRRKRKEIKRKIKKRGQTTRKQKKRGKKGGDKIRKLFGQYKYVHI